MTYPRTMISIHLMLIRFVYNMLDIYHYVQDEPGKCSDRKISIFKFAGICRTLSDKILDIRSIE